MTYYEKIQEMSDKWVESELHWMKNRQSDYQSCSLSGEDRSHRIRILEQEKEDRIIAGVWSL